MLFSLNIIAGGRVLSRDRIMEKSFMALLAEQTTMTK